MPDSQQTDSRERRAFYFFRSPLADDFKRMIMLNILHYVRTNDGAKMEFLYREFKTICPDTQIIDDAVQALANNRSLHGLTILRFRGSKKDHDNFSIKHRNSEHIASWEAYLNTTHPELVALVTRSH